MTLYQATLERHSVRQYLDKAIEAELVTVLQAKVDEINALSGLHIQLVTNEPKAFQSRLAKYGKFSGVSSYFVMAGTPSDSFDEAIGYYGEQLVLLAQTLGLSTCWVGLTYQKVEGAFTLEKGEKVSCVIALGYAANPGKQHNNKALEQLSNLSESSPAWFREAVLCAQNCPTAVNQQKYHFELQEDGKTVKASTRFSIAGYLKTDLGIAKYHFELGAAHYQEQSGENVEWSWK